MDQKLIAPLITGVVVAWLLYRRTRRAFGRQPVNVTRLWTRLGLLGAITALFFWSMGRDLPLQGALLGGIACGAVLGYFALRHTQFEATPEGHFYTPHTYFGLFVTALVLGRVLYRYLGLYASGGAAQPNPDPLSEYHKSPLTLVIFGLLIGYYLCFIGGVLRKSGNLPSPGVSSPQ